MKSFNILNIVYDKDESTITFGITDTRSRSFKPIDNIEDAVEVFESFLKNYLKVETEDN